jgi:hypothetical protein
MTLDVRVLHSRAWLGALLSCLVIAGCGGGGGGGGGPAPEPPTPVVSGPAWWNFGRDVQHAAQGGVATQALSRIVWQTAVDLVPPYLPGNVLHIHYGSPVITSSNTVLVPVKLNRESGFRVEARSGANGTLIWSAPTDYILPAHDWTPSYNIALTQGNRVYMPAAGGRLVYRDNADSASGALTSIAFYGNDAYDLARGAYDASVIINTPLTVDPRGNVYFGFVVIGTTPLALTNGIARVAPDGTATWVGVSAAANNPQISKVATNSAPALSTDLRTLYVAVNTSPPAPARPTGMLLALDADTLATRGQVELRDPATGQLGWVADNGSGSPSVGPDGDVYYGVLESNTPAHNFRGWLLHYDSTLRTTKLSGSFGWDQTVSFAPASMVPQYTGTSSYLVVSKYNNYFGVGTGNGRNQMAILDPSAGQVDSISAIPVMREVLLILGPTPENGQAGTLGAVREWCVNTVAVDPATSSVFVNNEDGRLYRWHLPSNTLSQTIRFNNGYAESYTPSAIGPDGKVYAINNATLFAVGQ